MTLETKHCKLKRCNKLFKQNRSWQDFCEPEHQREYHRRGSLESRIARLEKQVGI